MLYIVATPIGNLEDITYRAVRILSEVDSIACEDTRTSATLLNRYDIKKPLISYHSHSGQTKTDKIIEQLKKGQNIALISDAGTPGISDPGYILIKEAIMEGIEVVPIPGVTAFTTALMGSGMQMNHFLYLGFLPVKKGRQTLFKMLVERKNNKKEDETVVIYESVHRIVRTLKEIGEYFGSEHNIVVARELTKKFEEFKRGNVGEIVEYFENNPGKVKGEFVVLF
ncbi:MAG: 16S rRNA (cytidine(1402)-2'-O)-methyltransferase [Candidatus Gracilibacteria bacterium]|nr:16S rRNA (cytidine(1402)-2'-O)-methyltransferase [Candidatus Gracilibacteria bacterium]